MGNRPWGFESPLRHHFGITLVGHFPLGEGCYELFPLTFFLNGNIKFLKFSERRFIIILNE